MPIVLADVDVLGMEETLSLLAQTFLTRATSMNWPTLPIGRLENALA
jgi:hypothetical protein